MTDCPWCSPSGLPNGENAEKCVISCMLQMEAAIPAALAILKPSDFSVPAHGIVFDSIMKMGEEGTPATLHSLTAYLQSRSLLDAVGGFHGISDMIAAYFDPSQVRFFAREVLLMSKRRQMVKIGAEISRLAQNGSEECEWKDGIAAIMAPVMQRADLLLSDGNGSDIRELKEVAGKYLDFHGTQGPEGMDPPVPTGCRGLDSLLCGGVRKEYIIIGGKQGHGKTLAAMQLAGRLAAAGRPGLVVGYEMSDMEVLMRDIARESEVTLNEVMGREPFMNAGHANRVTRTLSGMMEKWDVGYIDNSRITLEAVMAHARARKRQGRLEWIVIDYLQLIPRRKQAKERSDELLMELSKQLNVMRKELDCTVIAPVQLNDDGLIRDGRSILDAPQVFLRIEMDEQVNDQTGESEVADTGKIRVLKNRFGANNRVCHVLRQGQFQRFTDHEPTPQQPQPRKTRHAR